MSPLPDPLTEIRDEFLALDLKERLQLLLEFSNELPELPERLQGRDDLFERVIECQAPVFLDVEVEPDSVQLHATAPREAPTTRGFASILVQGLSGLSPEDVLAVPADYPHLLGLDEAVSPLRVRGMTGMLARAKRQIAAKAAA